MDEAFAELVAESLPGATDEQLTGLDDVISMLMTLRGNTPGWLLAAKLKAPDDWVAFYRKGRRQIRHNSI